MNLSRSAGFVSLCFIAEGCLIAAVLRSAALASLVVLVLTAAYVAVRLLTRRSHQTDSQRARAAELKASRGALVDDARESVVLRSGRVPLQQFQIELREEIVVTLSDEPCLVAFIDLVGPARIQLATLDIVGCEEQAREFARRLRLPLRLVDGALEEPVSRWQHTAFATLG